MDAEGDFTRFEGARLEKCVLQMPTCSRSGCNAILCRVVVAAVRSIRHPATRKGLLVSVATFHTQDWPAVSALCASCAFAAAGASGA